ncbi:MAG: hypothetical protein Q8N15_07905, partial [Bacillota bacterium]|nr:hypothetical protein [Bacillota bacterium]
MKRLIPILLGCMFALGLLGCRQKLSVPTGLALSERTVSWNAVEGATDYILKVNDIEYPVMVPTMDLPEG